MCDDIQATLAELRGKGVEVTRDVSDRGWGFSQQSACQTARSFPSTSPGIRPPFEPDGMHSHAAESESKELPGTRRWVSSAVTTNLHRLAGPYGAGLARWCTARLSSGISGG